jgi:TRAP-type transport system periplasmic protein
MKFSLMVQALLLLALLTPVDAGAKTFKIATISPDGLAWMKKLRAGVKDIETQTGGRVQFKIYPGGVQGDDYTVLRKMRIGQLQGGAVAASSLTRFYPDLQIYSLPLKFHTNEEVDFVRHHMDDRIIDGLARSGVVSFALAETGFAYLLSVRPVNSLADLQNMKMWVPDGDPVAAKIIQSFGISPIPLHVTDVLAALQTGLVDAVMIPPLVALALQWHNQVHYMLDVPLVYTYSTMMLDKKEFDGIASEDQRVVETVMSRLFEEVDSATRTDNTAAYQALLNQGIRRTTPDPAQLKEWRDQAEVTIRQLVGGADISAESVEALNGLLRQTRVQADASASE